MVEGYDPHQYRNPVRPTNNFSVVVNLIKTTYGVGVLGLPYAISKAGYVMAIVLSIPAISLLVYCIHILIRTMYKVCTMKQQAYVSYEDCVRIVVEEGPRFLQKTATAWKYIIKILLVIYPLGIGTAYTIFIAQSIMNVFPIFAEEKGAMYIYEALIFLPLFLTNCLPTLHNMAIFATIGNVLTLVCVGGLLFIFYSEPPIYSGEHLMIGSPINVMMFSGVVLFAMEGISVIISIEEHMKTPKYFLGFFGLFNCSIFVVFCFYVLVGVTGFIKYGDTAMTSININLPSTRVALTIKYLFIFCIYYSYPIQCYPVISFVWEDHLMMKTPPKRRMYYECIFRFGITLINVLAAMALPKFHLMISLVSAICKSTLGYFFPSFMEYLYTWRKNEGRVNFTMVKDIFLMIYGLTISLTIIIAVVLRNVQEETDWDVD